jgi:hypothetical protein
LLDNAWAAHTFHAGAVFPIGEKRDLPTLQAAVKTLNVRCNQQKTLVKAPVRTMYGQLLFSHSQCLTSRSRCSVNGSQSIISCSQLFANSTQFIVSLCQSIAGV